MARAMKNNDIKPTFTVFTPTYNRAHTLHRVFDSLNNQTCQDFEWLIVDDGSNDSTAQLVNDWQKIAGFSIRYIFQENAGKHVAFNRAVSLAVGDLFLPIDSDDGFQPDSLEVMIYWWQQIPLDTRDTYTGIVTLCRWENGQVCGDYFSTSPLDTNALELRYQHRKRGETWGFHRTEVLKQYPFPIDASVRFVPENIVWDAIAERYKIRCINEPLRIFYQDAGNQITKANPQKKAAVRGYFLEMLNRDIRFLMKDPMTFIKWSILYVRYSLHAKEIGFLLPGRFRSLAALMLTYACVIPGVLVYLWDVLKASVSQHG